MRGKVNVVQSDNSSESEFEDEVEQCLWLTTVVMNEEVKCVDEHINAQNTKKIYALMKIKGNHRATKFFR